jgi:DNA-binding transcriptional ArsR family regulator
MSPRKQDAETGTDPAAVRRAKILRVFSHPLRLQIIRALENDRIASPSEIAAELGEPLNDVTYHVKVLESSDCVELMDRRSDGGAPPKSYYRRTVAYWFDAGGWEDLPPELQATVSGEILSDIVSESHASLLSGRFDARPDRHLSRSSLILDPEGWAELNAATDDLLELAHDIQTRALERLQNAAAPDSQRGLLNIMFYEPAPAAVDRGD